MSVVDAEGTMGAIYDSVVFNLRVLPESLVVGLVVLSIVLANYTLTVLAGGALLTQFFTAYVGSFVADGAQRRPACDSDYYGLTVNRLFGTPPPPTGPLAPSTYMATVGYLFGFGVALQQIYAIEIEKFKTGTPLTVTAIIGVMLVLLAFLFRVFWTKCDTVVAALGGTFFGFAIGYFGSVLLGYATNRRATNVWGIPFLQDRINKGSAIYIPV